MRHGRDVLLALVIALGAGGAAAAGHINVVTIAGSINPASSDYLMHAIAQSEAEGAVAVLIELDTPGGLLASTKDIIQAMLNAKLPVIVYVTPQGAWAASAGTFITLAGHVAAMAPGTSIGAASPVSATGGGGEQDEEGHRKNVGEEKAEKFTTAFIESIAKQRGRNVEWAMRAVRDAEAITQDKALEIGVIDLVATDRADLLRQLDGREVTLDDGTRKLAVAGAEIRTIAMTPLTRFFDFLANPDVAVLLVMAGLLGLYIEFQQPGMILPGVAGLICLVIAAFAFQILPFSWIGLLLMLLGMGLVAMEVFVPAFGALFAAGIACFLIGGSLIFDLPEVSDLKVSFWSVLVPSVGGFAIFAGVAVFAVGRSLMRAQTTGVSEMLGMMGKCATALAPEGKVFVRGEYWTAEADEAIPAGARVEVTAVEGMRLRVRRATGDH
ncbi:MAG TPA: nodulation protein NfeD [Myxococcota bacterium]|jgi:membrane-bound serine protease (ClpP class)